VREIIVDTGPLVALLNRRDEFHEWAVSAFSTIEAPLLTCEPVLTEAAYLVRKLKGGPEAVLDLVTRGALRVAFRVDGDLMALRTLLVRYASVPMSLADACLIRMIELQPRAAILTLDRDFLVYRRSGRHTVPVVMPEL
jgi:uncharacterized protein